MSFLNADQSTDGMVDYNENSEMQKQSVLYHSDMIRDLASRLTTSGSEIRIVDYGCGPGLSSVNTVRPAIETLIERFPDIPLHICHSDLPGNDWNALSTVVFGPDGYRMLSDSLRVETYIGSFFHQVAAKNSVDIATCFTASHWLSRYLKLEAPGTVCFNRLKGEARAKMAALAKSDWTQFLTHRAAELKSGGALLVSTIGAIPHQQAPHGVWISGHRLYDAIQQVAQEMVNDRLLDQSALDHFIMPFWFMTEKEARCVIEESEHLSKSFLIERLEVVPAKVNQSDIFGHLINDPENYGQHYARYLRGWGESSLLKFLFEPAAQSGKATSRYLLETFFDRFAAFYSENTARYAFDIWYLDVQLRKR